MGFGSLGWFCWVVGGFRQPWVVLLGRGCELIGVALGCGCGLIDLVVGCSGLLWVVLCVKAMGC